MEADTVIDTLVGQAIGGSGGGLNGGNGSGTVSQMSAAGGGTQTGGAAFGAGAANGRRRRFLWWIWSLTVHGGGSGYIGGVPSFKHTNGTTYSPSTTAGQRSGNGFAKITFITF